MIHEVYSYPELKTMKLIPKQTSYGTYFTVENDPTPVRVMEAWRSHLLRYTTGLVGVRLDGPSGRWTALVVTFKRNPSRLEMISVEMIAKRRPLPRGLDLRIAWDE